MQENTNKTIVVNSIVLYARLAIVSVCGLLYTRFGLQALGESDYGLFAVVGGMVALMAIANSIMVSVSNRYMAIGIGKKNEKLINKTFNVNLIIHLAIAVITVIVATILGHWYIDNYINYIGDVHNVYWIYDISTVSSAISFIGVPYNGLLMAKERFFVFCSTDVGAALLKLFVTWLLIYHFEHKLLIYAFTMAFMTAYPTVVFIAYCKKNFSDYVHFSFVKEPEPYLNVLKFATGVGIGTFVGMTKLQGTQLIINAFFGTMVNSAIAVANTVNQLIQMFANNINKSIAPQIYKSYAVLDENRYTYLLCLCSRVTYMAMLTISLPFLLMPTVIFGLWLKNVPDGTILFSRLMITDILIVSLNAGIVDLIFASGKIYRYQIVVNTIITIAILSGFFAVKNGMGSASLLYCYIASSFLIFFIRPFILVRVVKINIYRLLKESYIPVLTLTMLVMPLFYLKKHVSLPFFIPLAVCWYGMLVFIIGLNKNERKQIVSYVVNRINKKSS